MKIVCTIFIILAALMPTGMSGFPDFIGYDFDSAKVKNLVNFINAASVLYRDDFKKNLQYIHSSMMAAYGSDKQIFGLIIQGNSTNSSTDTWLAGGASNSASFAAGINLINPSWSYLTFFYTSRDLYPLNVEYVGPSSRGAGISDTTAASLNQLIKANDTSPCKCSQTNLWIKLNIFDQQMWEVACHSLPQMHGLIPSYQAQWMNTKPGPCYYLIFVS